MFDTCLEIRELCARFRVDCEYIRAIQKVLHAAPECGSLSSALILKFYSDFSYCNTKKKKKKIDEVR